MPDPKDCPHLNFTAHVAVSRLFDKEQAPELAHKLKPDRYQADVRIVCGKCGVSMRFLGLPTGLDMTGAAVSADGCEARLAISPKGEVLAAIDGAPLGFTVKRTK